MKLWFILMGIRNKEQLPKYNIFQGTIKSHNRIAICHSHIPYLCYLDSSVSVRYEYVSKTGMFIFLSFSIKLKGHYPPINVQVASNMDVGEDTSRKFVNINWLG